jgi:predicted ATPase
VIAEIHQGLAAYRAVGAAGQLSPWLVLLAEAFQLVGQSKRALQALADAMAAIHHTGERYNEAEAYRLQGEFLLRQATPDATQAEACFQQALAVARRQQAKSLELRTAMSLSRLWQHQGKCAEAYELLAPVYGWFTEGFDTVDLQEARGLLEALKG